MNFLKMFVFVTMSCSAAACQVRTCHKCISILSRSRHPAARGICEKYLKNSCCQSALHNKRLF